MSLVGIDVGSTSVKAAAFREDGALLALTRKGVAARHDRRLKWLRLVTREYPLERAADALAAMERQEVVKAVIRP